MVQELVNLRASILQGRFADALLLIDELEGMSRQAILRNIESFLVRLLIHLIKNQVEQRLNNSWAASIRGSIIEIKKLNLQDNKTTYYIKPDEWSPMLEEVIELAIGDASVEVMDGAYSPFQLVEIVDRTQVTITAQKLLALTYSYSSKELPTVINNALTKLPGGEDWKFNRQNV